MKTYDQIRCENLESTVAYLMRENKRLQKELNSLKPREPIAKLINHDLTSTIRPELVTELLEQLGFDVETKDEEFHFELHIFNRNET